MLNNEVIFQNARNIRNMKIGKSGIKIPHLLGLVLLIGSVSVNLYLFYGRQHQVSSTVSETPSTTAIKSQELLVDFPPTEHFIINNGPEVEGAPPAPSPSRPIPGSTIYLSEKQLYRSGNSVANKNKNISSTHSDRKGVVSLGLYEGPVSWTEFTTLPLQQMSSIVVDKTGFNLGYEPVVCSDEISDKLNAPGLPQEDFRWCRWALDQNGGKVVVGKSWGTLKKNDQHKFDKLNCNAVNSGKNPSCDDSWGDIHIKNWKKQRIDQLRCGSGRTSDVNCMKNDNHDVYCEISNAMIDFSRVEKVSRPNNTPSKKFQSNFLSTDCKADKMETDFPFPHLYSPQLSSKRCDVVYNGTLLMYSHDDIRNLGHTLNDIMNVWVMLWMSGLAKHAKSVDMINIDSFKLGHNFDDKPNHFFSTYRKSMHEIFRGIDFQGKTLCAKKLLVQPTPPRFFIWESWFVDMPCSFVGPSTLYQRWNLHVRQDWGLVSKEIGTAQKLKVLLIVRNEHSNMWGNQRTSRNYLNLQEIENGLKRFITSLGNSYELAVQDLSKLNFIEQLRLISDTSIMVGMHGAGIASSMHMSIGTKYCCGVLEIYPQGDFFPILGHGNMARKMGIHYDRYDLSAENSQGHGGYVPVDGLLTKLKSMIDKIIEKPTCIRKEVIENPYLVD